MANDITLLDCFMNCVYHPDSQKEICDGTRSCICPAEIFLLDLVQVY